MPKDSLAKYYQKNKEGFQKKSWERFQYISEEEGKK